jgi:hypothetical protein
VSQKLADAVEEIADAADHGNVLVEVVRDGGCCGWDNEGDDHTLFFRNGQATTIYDERERFHNDNYDVSFFTARVKLSADATLAAYTLLSTATPGAEIRLADFGKESPGELQRVKKAIGEMPRVEVLAVADAKKIAVSLPGELVGWLDGKRLLVVQAGELVVVDAASGAKTPTRIKADSAQHVFVR